VIFRVAIAVVALAAAVWLGVELRSSTAQDEMIGLAFQRGTPTKADLQHAQRLAPRARTLNPDVRVDESLGVLQLRTGDRRTAITTFERLTRTEPRNAELWAALAQAAQGYDDALATRARDRARALAPAVKALN
jgi:Flp pilus assembly protein TadD